jgi:undecaprenyl-diphosphatase
MISLHQILVSIILGVIQGISEWLPISSKTQILIASQFLLNLSYQQAYTFGLFMEIGTLFAAIIYFRKELVSLIKVLIRRGTPEERKLFNFVLVSTIVTGIIGVPLYLYADSLSNVYIGIPMMIMGIILFIDALLIKYARTKYAKESNRHDLHSLRLRDYIFVGIAQGIAALPGVSRSGATTSTLLLLNVEAKEAFRLSFVDMIFATAASIGVTLVFSRHTVMGIIAQINILGLAIAILVSTVISLFLIRFLLKIAANSKIVYLTFALGCIALASGIILTIFH